MGKPQKKDVDSLLAKFMPAKMPVSQESGLTALPKYMPKLVWPEGSQPQLSPVQLERINEYLNKQSGASVDATALICEGHACEYKVHCPLFQMDPNLVPLNQACPIELSLADMWVEEYKQDLEIDDDNIVDLAILKQYVAWLIFDRRARQEMGRDPKILRREFAGVDTQGNVLMKESMNPIFLMLEKGSKRQQKLMESLLATREAKSKADGGKQQNLSSFLIALTARVEEKKTKKKRGKKITTIDGEVVKETAIHDVIQKMAERVGDVSPKPETEA